MQPILLKRAFAPLATSVRMTALRSTPAMMQKPLTYIEEQYTKGRFVSPHLSIYKLHWATLSSGCHRLTGMGLWMGFTAVGIAACCTVNIDNMLNWVRLHSLVNYPLKFLLTYAFGYHFCAGLRHLYFDFNPEKLNWNTIQKSSIAIIWGMAFIALGLTFLKLKPLEDKKEKKN